jgi:hypothetical protein
LSGFVVLALEIYAALFINNGAVFVYTMAMLLTKLQSKKAKGPTGLLLLYGLLPLFLMFTNPDKLPLPLLLVPFLIIFTALFLTVMFVGSHTHFLKGISTRRKYAIAGFVAALPMLLALFQSLHQLTIRDVLIAVALIVGVIFYISRADFLR